MSEATAPSETATETPAASITPGDVSFPTYDQISEKLPAELKGSNYWKGFEGKENVVEALVNDGMAATSLIGSQDRIARPKEGASDAEWDAFWTKLGRPETADGYKFADDWKAPEDLIEPAQLKAMMQVFHQEGASNAQADKFVKAFAYLTGQQRQAMWDADAARIAAGQEALKSEWGSAYDAQVELAKRGIAANAGDRADSIATLRLQDGTPLGQHPEFVRMFAKMGGNAVEGKFEGGDTPNLGMTPQQAREKLSQLENQREWRNDFLDPASTNHAANQAENKRLHEIAASGGEQSIF